MFLHPRIRMLISHVNSWT